MGPKHGFTTLNPHGFSDRIIGAIKSGCHARLLSDFRTQIRILDVQDPTPISAASLGQLPEDQAVVGGPAERVFVWVRSLGDQELVGLVDAGCQAWL